jgi:hypothetical protein
MQDNTTTVSVTYQLDEARYMRACHALWAYRAIGRTGNYVIAGVVTLCALFLFWQGVPGILAPLMIVGVAIFVALDIGRDLLWRRHFRNLTKYTAPITATVGPIGVGVDGAEGVHHQPWSSFQHFAVTDAFVFLLIDQRQFSVIPLDAFATPARAAAFEAVLIDHLKRLPRRYF